MYVVYPLAAEDPPKDYYSWYLPKGNDHVWIIQSIVDEGECPTTIPGTIGFVNEDGTGDERIQ